jgi:RES domain-containing protein
MKVYRICRLPYAAFDGEGARRKSGRWNQDGIPVVYTAATLALAALETLAHTDPTLLPPDLVYLTAELPARLRITRIDLEDLPADWRQYPESEATKEIGANWVKQADTAVLAVPSTIIPIEYNYLLNPAHRDFPRIKLAPPEKFVFDPRLLL